MLDFILSKMNMLIFVVAIFAIVAYFTFGLTDIMKVKEAQLLLNRVSKKVFALVSSPSYCFSDSYDLPPSIEVAGNQQYYVMKLSVKELQLESGGSTKQVMLSIIERAEMNRSFKTPTYKPKVIAADSFRTDSTVRLFSQDYEGDKYGEQIVEKTDEGEIFLDPQARIPMNSVEFIKEIIQGKQYVYLILCNANLCEAAKTYVGETIVHPPPQEGFGC